jgi:hypothetical protein
MGRRRIRRQAERAAYKSEEEGARTALTERGYKSGRLRAERRQSAVATGGRTAEGRGTDAQQRVPTKAPRPSCGGRFGARPSPLYVSAKRTHRFSGRFFAYHQYYQLLMSFAEPVCRWVRFGKRTHREGVFEGSLQESGYVLRITDEHGRRHGRSRTCRERMSVPLYKGSLLGPEKTWKRGRAFAIMGTSREAARLWPLGVFNNSWKTRPKYL